MLKLLLSNRNIATVTVTLWGIGAAIDQWRLHFNDGLSSQLFHAFLQIGSLAVVLTELLRRRQTDVACLQA